eukprot:g783.t1
MNNPYWRRSEYFNYPPAEPLRRIILRSMKSRITFNPAGVVECEMFRIFIKLHSLSLSAQFPLNDFLHSSEVSNL